MAGLDSRLFYNLLLLLARGTAPYQAGIFSAINILFYVTVIYGNIRVFVSALIPEGPHCTIRYCRRHPFAGGWIGKGLPYHVYL